MARKKDGVPDLDEKQDLDGQKRNGFFLLEVPLQDPDAGGYMPEHVELRLNRRESLGLKRLYDGLHSSAAKLRDGSRYVNYNVDAIRWILEQLGDAKV